MRYWLALLLALGAVLVGSAARAQEYVPNALLVKFRPGTSSAMRAAAHHATGATIHNRIAVLDVDVVSLPPGETPEQAAAVYSRNGNVQYAEPDTIARPASNPNDPFFAQQWGLTKIQAPLAWNTTQGSADVSIAILDSGIDENHPDLGAKVAASQNFSSSPTTDDNYGHGTHLAGIAAAIANNGIGVAGVAPGCTLLNVKVMEDRTGGASASALSQGITWAANAGAKVICMSLGSPSPSQTVEDAVNYAWGLGAVLVASAGNTSDTTPNYPAAYQNCISVAATDPSDQREVQGAFGSTYGAWVDVAAPGLSILSTLPTHSFTLLQQDGLSLNYGVLSGTSQAAAFVAGVAALVWSGPFGTSNDAVRSRIESTCDHIPGTGTLWSSGRVNAARAVGATP